MCKNLSKMRVNALWHMLVLGRDVCSTCLLLSVNVCFCVQMHEITVASMCYNDDDRPGRQYKAVN